MRCLALLVLLGFASVSHEYEIDPTKKRGSQPLFRINRDGKVGFIDRTGRIAIPPQFSSAGDFFEGLAWFKPGTGGKLGFIDDKGNTAIEPRFDDALDFHEGLAPVRIGRRWGYVDRSGKLAIPLRFQGAAEFHDGRASIQLWNRTTCGKSVFTKNNAPEMAFRRSYMPDCVPSDLRSGFIDRAGKSVIEAQFRIALDFSDGLAAVYRIGSQKCEFIDVQGETAIPANFDTCGSFSDGLAAVLSGLAIQNNRKTAGKYGFIDKSGKFVFEPRFELVREFREGFAAVMLTPKWWGYVDRTGKFLTTQRFREAESFSDGLAGVCTHSGDCFYIDLKGQRLPGINGRGRRFADGLTFRGGNYVDRSGRIVFRR